MFDPSPVLTGAASQNTATQAANIDPRRYSQWDRTASNVGDATMSFGDFLDMVNPLQHIPVISSVYREITGDKINPVSRIAGDVLYGAALGPATAIMSGISAIADSAMEENTGKDVTGSVFAALFGDEKEQSGDGATMLASAAPVTLPAAETATTPNTQVADAPKQTMTAEEAIAALSSQQVPAMAGQPVMQLAQQQGIPLTRNKMPFGGAIAPVKSASEQNMAMAVAQSTGMHVGNVIYPSRNIGTHGIPAHVAPIASAAPATSTTTTRAEAATSEPAQPAVSSAANNSLPATPLPNAGSMSLPPALAGDAAMLKALSMYQNVAGGMNSRSSVYDTMN